MATPPTFVAEYETGWTVDTTPRTISVTVTTGDMLVIVGITADQALDMNDPTGGSLVYTNRQEVNVGNWCRVTCWTAPATSNQTFTLSITGSGTGVPWGYNCLRFSGVSAIGASNKSNPSSGAPGLALTTTGANSTVVTFCGDWNASSAARTWRTVNVAATEVTYLHSANNYTAHGAYYTDTGAAGAKTVNLSAPTDMKPAMVAVELLGTTVVPNNHFLAF